MKKKEDRRGQRMIIISRSPFPRKLERDDKDAREASSLKKFRRTTNEGFYLARQIPTFRVLLAHLLRILLLFAVLRVCVCVYIYIHRVSLRRRFSLSYRSLLNRRKSFRSFQNNERALRFAFLYENSLSGIVFDDDDLQSASSLSVRCFAKKTKEEKSEKKKNNF